MARVISIHEYELKASVQDAAFERALNDAERRGLFDLPGLIEHHFLRGLKGARRGAYTPADLDIREPRSVGEALGNSGSAASGRGLPRDLEDLGRMPSSRPF